MKYRVVFTQYYEYEVEAKNDSEAHDKAHQEFAAEMRHPVANTVYDEMEIERLDDEEDYDDESWKGEW